MKKHLVFTLIIILIPLLFVSCISTILQEKPPTFSTEVQLTAPATPFVAQKASVFPSWKNSNSGNVIAIVSDCSKENFASLQQMQNLIEDSISEIKTIKEESITLHGKPATKKHVSGLLELTPIEVVSISFQRGTCSYITSLSGKLNSIKDDLSTFQQFNEGLKFE